MASLGDIRQKLFDRVDWDPGASEEAVRKVNGFIDDAVQQIGLEAAFLFHEDEVRFRTQPVVEPTMNSDFLNLVTDTTPANTPVNPWTLTTVLDRATTGVTAWKVDRTWDGRWIDLMDNTRTVLHRSRIQSVSNWNDGSDDLVKITLATPVNHTILGTGPFNWRVYTPVVWLADDIIEVRNIRYLDDNNRSRIRVIGQAEAEQLILPGSFSTGTSRFAFRRGHYELPSPNTAPAATIGDPAELTERWQGPEPPGKFSYKITLTWGKRHPQYQNSGPGWWAGGASTWDNAGPGSTSDDKSKSEDRFKEPLWESAPSPVSAEVTVVAPATTSTNVGAVKLVLPNFEYMLGYLMSGTTSAATAFERENTGLSGWHVRIYRRRHSEDFTNYTGFGNNQLGQSIDTLQKLDIDDAYYLLMETSIDDVNGGVIWDYGRLLPDYRRRIRDVHGYQGLRLWPLPSEELDIAMRVLRRPKRLISDRDAPAIHAEAMDLVVTKASVYLYEMLKDYGSMGTAEAKYQARLSTLTNRFGDMRPAHEPIYRRRARAKGYRRSRALWNPIETSGGS